MASSLCYPARVSNVKLVPNFNFASTILTIVRVLNSISFFYRYQLFLLREDCGNLEGNRSRYKKFIWTLRVAKNEGLAGDIANVREKQRVPCRSRANSHEKCQL